MTARPEIDHEATSLEGWAEYLHTIVPSPKQTMPIPSQESAVFLPTPVFGNMGMPGALTAVIGFPMLALSVDALCSR
jgi:hypothetical protein